MTNTIFEFTGKTIEEAISLGVEKLGVSVADVDIKVLDEGSKGLFGLFGSKSARVVLTLKSDESAKDIMNSMEADNKAVETSNVKETKEAVKKDHVAEKPVIKHEEHKPVAVKTTVAEEQKKPENKDEIEAKALEFLTTITNMMGVEVNISIRPTEDNNLYIDMFGDELGILIGRRGETLDSLQYLTSLAVNRQSEDFIRVILDSENYREKREEALVRLANRMANRAIKTGKRVVMEPMNPYERRILHSSLQGNNAVSTHSEGEEPNRHIVITVNK